MKKADEVIRALVPALSMREAGAYFDLFSSWSDILGENLADIAAHSEPVDLKNSALIVYADHPGWMQKLDFSKRTIIRRLQKRYPQLGISSIFVQKVTSERFLERREARMLGSTGGPQKRPEMNHSQARPSSEEPAVPELEHSPEKGESGKRTDNTAVPVERDPDFAATLKRFEQLGKNAGKG